jgi:hypothetical protein
MKAEYLDQLAVWFHEEVEGFKAKGASEEILKEPAFTSLLVQAVFQNHIDEILSDPAFVEEIILAHCQTASPSELRKMAAQDREKESRSLPTTLRSPPTSGNEESSIKLASATA